MEDKIKKLLAKIPELELRLGDPEVIADRKEFCKLSREHAYLSELNDLWEKLLKRKKELQENRKLLRAEEEEELRALIEEEILRNEKQIPELEEKIERLLIPPDPRDDLNIIVELRAGTGGEEAALFVADCVRMYNLFADRMGWKCEQLSRSDSGQGGFKEYIMVMTGKNVHRYMQYEGGTHRVQRVPDTESQGRVHTSAITVAILPEPEDTDIRLEEKDLRIDTYRASGAGGQHVNTTDSAVRITHVPSGVVAYCSEERSQHKNKDKAMRLLKAKISDYETQKKNEERSSLRGKQVGSGDRSERIRTYNFPQNRLTDHRIHLTVYSLDRVMNGELEGISDALIAHFYRQKWEE